MMPNGDSGIEVPATRAGTATASQSSPCSPNSGATIEVGDVVTARLRSGSWWSCRGVSCSGRAALRPAHDGSRTRAGWCGMSEYVLDHHQEGERERLALMSRLLDPMHRRHIERLGVGPGARTLEVGCGNGTMSAWLAGRVVPGEI